MIESREELARIMEEPPGGENFGYRCNGNGTRESLNGSDWRKGDFLATGGWTTTRGSRLPSGLPRGRPRTIKREWMTPKAIASVEARLGFTREEFRSVVRKGRLSADDRELRQAIARRLSEVVGTGAVVSALAEVLDCDPQTLWRLVRK